MNGNAMESPKIRRALISVSDKSGLVEFVQELTSLGVEIYSTGGTRRAIEQAGLPVQDVSSYTGFPELMDGRLKTLHPKVFGGILCRHDRSDDLTSLADHAIHAFELVVVNLYPFEQTVAAEGFTHDQAIEQIDIGGPSLIRAAAKNHLFVTIATEPAQYAEIVGVIKQTGATTESLRKRLAAAAFLRTASYDRAIATYFSQETIEGGFARFFSPMFQRKAVLRYGENPHQTAALYAEPGDAPPSVVNAEQLHGKELSYNNLLDLDSAYSIVSAFSDAAAAVIKHNNPCGVATAPTLADATRKALGGDPISAFGSILGLSHVVDVATAELLCEPGLFVEAIIAPDFDPKAVEILSTRPKWKQNVRLMKVGTESQRPSREHELRQIGGGLLLQDRDDQPDDEADWEIVTTSRPSDDQFAELRFAWNVVRFVKSNAIVITKDHSMLGAGAGQMSRVDSVNIAISKAGDRIEGSALASDAFFPFPDSIQRAAEVGIRSIIQPGGSRRDQDVIAACNDHGLAMVFTGRRHFRH